MQKTDTLIRTKLHLPFTRSRLVTRPRLQEQIEQGLHSPLTLITAPAGFGKTTLAAACIANCELPIAWVSLDKDDNQVERFLNYLVAALQETDPTIGSGAVQLLTAVHQAPPKAVLASLINDLDSAGGEVVLVLDDYQFITNQAVHEEVTFLLEHCPRTFHLVIATRSDPPLPLTRLRARGQTVELRAADLRFTVSEAAQFLNDVMGLSLDAGSVAVLAERTEGWITGLQMAALSMRDRKDALRFIEGFSGTNRYILDYLLEEVMASQPPEIQQFLLCTSILERLTAPLCEAVLAAGKKAGWFIDESSSRLQPPSLQNCQSILEYLERSNLFVVPLDDERIWYRYHHLFADLLNTRLQQTLNDQDVAALHTQAALWFKQNGLTNEAILHASLTSNNEWVEQLIEENYMEMFHRGEASSMRFWTGKLSKELIYRRPWLCIYEAQSHALFGELDEAEALLAKAEEHLRLEVPIANTKPILGHLAYIKSRVIGMRGDVQQAIELSLIARENTPTSNQALQSGIGVNLGVVYFLDGDFTNAIQTFNETIRSSMAAKAINGTMAAYCHLARLYAIQGQLHKSYQLYQDAGKFAQEMGGRNLGVMSLVDMGIATVLFELNDLEGALAHIKKGLEFIPLWGNADDIALAYTIHARIQQAQGNIAGALEAIEKGVHLIQTSGVFSFARDAVMTTKVKLWLAQGDLLSAESWAVSQEKRLIPDKEFRFENELTRITLARVFIAQKKSDETIRLLARLEESAESGGRLGRLIEILLLKALTFEMSGETVHALTALEKSLRQAEPEGYIRIFMHEGQPMQRLLAQSLAHTSSGPIREYTVCLLSQFDSEWRATKVVQEKNNPAESLVEPLSQRELEVLQLINLGKTNKEIAHQLFLSLGTVKAHTASIYRKLDVAVRTEAVARARQLGILP
jgi:ATP/maltotriose-dependent transcriptional regulator MalT